MGRRWTDHDIDQLRELYPKFTCLAISRTLGRTERAVYGMAKKLGISKPPNAAAEAGRRGACHPRAIANQFKPGHATWNKGTHFTAGGRSAETRFKPGTTPPNHKPVGSERVADGYLQRKLTDTGYPPRDWVPVHHIVWREAGREIPPAHALVFRDGNRSNFAIDNLELVSRADLMRRNTRHQLPPEINELISLRAALVRKINRRAKDQQP